MAGHRHHILPRFLLKGFASRVEVKSKDIEVFTWVYRKDGKLFENNTKNISVERHFYGKAGEPNVDDEITDIEKEFTSLLDDLRTKTNGEAVIDPRLPAFVTHLTSRTKHLRDSLIDTSEILFSTLFNYFADYSNFRSWLFHYYKRHPEVITNSIGEALGRMQLHRFQRRKLRQYMIQNLRLEHVMAGINKDKVEYQLLFGTLGSSFLEQLPGIVKESHIKALAKDLVPEPRAEDYRRLHWFVCKPEVPMILGDLGCLFEVAGAKKLKAFNDKDDEIRNAYLPISSDTLIVGTSKPEPPKVDLKFINEGFAKNSREFFVSRESSEEMNDLQSIIGTEANIFSKAEIEQLVREVINESC